MNFNKFRLTKDGKDLLNKTTLGEKLVFTKVGFGSGNVKSINEMINLTKLIEPKLSVPINGIENNNNGTCTIHIAFDNSKLEYGFLMKEIGIYAEDPEKGEILYFICNTGDDADFLPAKSTNLVEQMMDFIVIVADSPNVEVKINDSLIYVTKEEFKKATGKEWTFENIKQNADDINILKLQLASFMGSVSNGLLGENDFIVTFEDFGESEEYEGVWDETRKKLGVYPGGVN